MAQPLPALTVSQDLIPQLQSIYKNPETRDHYGDNTSCEQKLQRLFSVLGTPPGYTVLRVNTRITDVKNAEGALCSALHCQYQAKKMPVPSTFRHADLKDVIIVRNTGPHLELPLLDKEVIVDLACGMAVLRGAYIFAQGVMAAEQSIESDDEVSVFVDLDGTCRKGSTQVFNGNKVFLGNGVAKMSRSELFVFSHAKRPTGVAVQMQAPLYDAPCLNQLFPDLLFPQNLPSVVCGHVLNPQPGETVLDMCSAPGGKTSHLATLMRDEGRVVALEKSQKKLSKVATNCKNWSISCVEVYAFDSTKAVDSSAELSGPPPYPPGSFDRVLLDGPCSALGQRPSLKNRISLRELNSYRALQKNLFKAAVALLKAGGVLVYSTCTIVLEENEMMVKWVLDKFPELSLERQEPHIGGAGLLGAGLTEAQRHLLQRFDPSDVGAADWFPHPRELTSDEHSQMCNKDTIGFFIAKFRKVL